MDMKDFDIFDHMDGIPDKESEKVRAQEVYKKVRNEFKKISKEDTLGYSLQAVYIAHIIIDNECDCNEKVPPSYRLYANGTNDKDLQVILDKAIQKFIKEGNYFFHYYCHQLEREFPRIIDEYLNYNNIKDLEEKDNYKFVHGNITDRSFVYDLFAKEKFDVVINFAAESHVDNSIKDPEIFLRTNIIGTEVLMDACLKYNASRYHQVSTDEVYGDLPLDRKDLLFTENTPIHTSSPYSTSKASADLLVGAYHRTYGLNTTISRCSNNYGPYQFPEKLIPLTISKALKDEKIPVYGTGENVRDWIHVIDHNIGVDLIVRNGKSGEVYNLGGHSERTNLEIVKIILKQLGKSEDLIEFVTDRKGHDLRYAIDSSKVEKELGWERTYTFEKGIKETIDWYLNNEEWLNAIKDGSYKNSYKD